MTNLVDAAAAALTCGSPWAPLAAAACGAATAVGPCAAPRAAALAALTAGGARRGRLLCAAAFVVGICTCYATAGYLAACAGKAVVASPLAYDLTALALCAAGLYGLLADRCAAKASPSAGFALAGLCSSAASPCCTALIVPIAIAAADAGQPARAALLMACFSLGHVFPSAAAAVWTHMRRNSSGMRAYLPALRTVAAAVTLATGVYYAVLA